MPQHGYAPYEESSFRSALRLLAAGARGAVSAPAGGGLLGGFFSGYDASARASEEAQKAAQAYAMKQQEMEDRRLHQEMQRKFMEAQIKAQEKPPKETTPDIYRDADEETFNRYLDRKRREAEAVAAARAKSRPVKAPRAPKEPGPPKPREAVLKRIDLIRQADPYNPEHRARLMQIIRNPATPEEQKEAMDKLAPWPVTRR